MKSLPPQFNSIKTVEVDGGSGVPWITIAFRTVAKRGKRKFVYYNPLFGNTING